MFTSGVFYCAFVLTIVVSLLPDVVISYWARQERPHDWEILQEADVLLNASMRRKTGAAGASIGDHEEHTRLLPASGSVQQEARTAAAPLLATGMPPRGYGAL
jgi:hypothetical protein